MSYYMNTTGQEEVLKTVVPVGEKFQTSVRCHFEEALQNSWEESGRR